MQFVLILLVIAGGMGLSVEAGLLGPLGGEVGDLWATFSIFGVGAALTFLLMLFFSPRSSPSFFAQPGWQLLGGVLGIALALSIGWAFQTFGASFTLLFSTGSIVAAFACSTLIGVAFGFLPARNAAQLDPVEALARE